MPPLKAVLFHVMSRAVTFVSEVLFSGIVNGAGTEKQVTIIHSDPVHFPDNVYSLKFKFRSIFYLLG